MICVSYFLHNPDGACFLGMQPASLATLCAVEHVEEECRSTPSFSLHIIIWGVAPSTHGTLAPPAGK